MTLTFAVVDVDDGSVQSLVAAHRAFARAYTPECHVHALDLDGLRASELTLFGVRSRAELVGVGALRELDPQHGEVKTMHTRSTHRRRGVGRAVLDGLLRVSRERGYRRVSLETGTMEAFAAARGLYTSTGFRPCEPFGNYTVNTYSMCMSLDLDRR